MTLFITFLAATVATIAWYVKSPNNTYRIGALALMYWAAALMWCVDGAASLMEGGAFIDVANAAAMIDDALLGLFVVAIGLAAWALYLVLKDPKRAFAAIARG